MKHAASILTVIALFLLVSGALWCITPMIAQSGGGYDLAWNMVDSGGAVFSIGGSYSVGGTAGQPDAGLLTGGGYTSGGGFWGGGALFGSEYHVYPPPVFRQH